MRVRVVAPGPVGHGVVRHALDVAALLAAGSPAVDVEVVRTLDAPAHPRDVTHTHFTDALFGSDIALAADSFVRWAREVPGPLVVTLHDVPGGGADPDAIRDHRRLEGYARVARATDAVIVSGRHELAGVRSAGVEPWVVPLPVPAAPTRTGRLPSPDDPPTVAVLGFVYPGKGHAEALHAAAGLDPRPQVLALGAVSPGHEALVADLREQAAGTGVDLRVTGPLSQSALLAAAASASVPFAAYSTIGSSGSLATWLAAGRRPIATGTPYARELCEIDPGCLHLLPARPTCEQLTRAVARALDAPDSTWLEQPFRRHDTAAAHLEVFRYVLRGVDIPGQGSAGMPAVTR